MNSFYVVTPVYNAESTIGRTIKSIVNQTYKGPIYYHIQDGSSTDNTLAVIKSTLDGLNIPGNISITVSSKVDGGMYEAICEGFNNFNVVDDNDWFTWINSDDYLYLDAIENVDKCSNLSKDDELNWVSGRISVLNEQGICTVSEYDLHNSYIMRHGIAEGKNWSFLQQEGTFFRVKCFRYAISAGAFKNMRYAGDWNLWRTLAHKYELNLVSKPLGTFCVTPGQISQIYRRKYMGEIDGIVSEIIREQFNLDDHERDNLKVNVFDFQEDGSFVKRLHDIYGHFKYRNQLAKSMLRDRKKFRELAKGVAKKICMDGSHIYLDYEWQYPAVTEKNAFERLKNLKIDGDVCLLSFPWATYFDLENLGKERALVFKGALSKLKRMTSGYKRVVTVCQHVLMKDYLELLSDVGVTDVFWAHSTKSGSKISEVYGIEIHPFPLFAVNYVDESSGGVRDIIFNFVGANSNGFYLTDTRGKIFQFLSGIPNSVIALRDKWHFHEVVHSKQIHGRSESNVEDTKRKTEEFKSLLSRSIFTLCPSGSGPNSIRLWEAIGSGSIPVILADTYLPPGEWALWEQAVVFCEENEVAIKSLPQRLLDISTDSNRLEVMRGALKQLWLLYGPETFVTDVEVFLRKNSKIKSRLNYRKPSLDFEFIDQLLKLDKESIPDGVLVNSFLIRVLLDPATFRVEYNDTLSINPKIAELLKHAIQEDRSLFLGEKVKSLGIDL